ncbi:hypothetical protein NECAME_19049 [Necator americanus]|uniref:Uncharacterized protein n=1 Tax=Necator americanus TaxID=51031 RepID=W2SR83_NECAM|nr:hypothetical protein NECAME_19049 [Necator americanus]ETN72023.1 hypothetical protein NECAME_19049 [Necator americanus]
MPMNGVLPRIFRSLSISTQWCCSYFGCIQELGRKRRVMERKGDATMIEKAEKIEKRIWKNLEKSAKECLFS